LGFGVEGGKYGVVGVEVECILGGGIGAFDVGGLVAIVTVVGGTIGFGVMGGGALVGVGEGEGVMTVVMA